MFDPANYGPQIEALRSELVARYQERLGMDQETAERAAEEAFDLAKERLPEVVQSILAGSGLGAFFGGR
jgi:hypothetical protein